MPVYFFCKPYHRRKKEKEPRSLQDFCSWIKEVSNCAICDYCVFPNSKIVEILIEYIQNFNNRFGKEISKIFFVNKAKRRIIAFYNEALKHSEFNDFNRVITWFKDLIDRDIDL